MENQELKTNMEFKTMSNGCKMPVIGLGTWLSDNEEELMNSVESALQAGYRHFDTANLYMNEGVIGKVLKKWLTLGKVKREDLFVTTKLPAYGMVPEKVGFYLTQSLKNLQLDYVDLYLIHIPFGLDYQSDPVKIDTQDGNVEVDYAVNLEGIWKSMEEQVHLGKVKSIGVSNFDGTQVERIVSIATIPPANLQIEMHAYLQQKSIRAVCAKYGISVCAHSSLRTRSIKECFTSCEKHLETKKELLTDPVVLRVASRCCKAPTQVLLRFLVQKGVVIIPKSKNAIRLKENMQLFDFLLSPEEMESIESLDMEPGQQVLDLKQILPGLESSPGSPEK